MISKELIISQKKKNKNTESINNELKANINALYSMYIILIIIIIIKDKILRNVATYFRDLVENLEKKNCLYGTQLQKTMEQVKKQK